MPNKPGDNDPNPTPNSGAGDGSSTTLEELAKLIKEQTDAINTLTKRVEAVETENKNLRAVNTSLLTTPGNPTNPTTEETRLRHEKFNKYLKGE